MLSKLVPRLQVHSIYDIDLTGLWNSGIRGIITDLDNTLVGAKEPLATPELILWLEELRRHGFKAVIVSNNHRPRVSKFAEPLGIPFIYRAKKPSNSGFSRSLQVLGLSAQETAVIGDQLMTDVLGGNRMGLFTILVQPISIGDEGIGTKVNRLLERAARKLMKQKER